MFKRVCNSNNFSNPYYIATFYILPIELDYFMLLHKVTINILSPEYRCIAYVRAFV